MRKTFFLLLLSIIFYSSKAADFYWIGGSGNWTDLTHWATTSGGSTNPATLPAAGDDVFFDANSFTGAGQTVTLISGDKFCRNMNWTGVTNNPTLNVGSARMHIYGSLTLNAAMTLTNTLVVNAGFYFEATTSGQTIQTFGQTLYYDVFFRGAGTASWTLLDELRAFDRIYFQGGSLNTNNQNITMMSTQGQIFFSRDFPSSFTGAPIVINLGSSTLTASHVGSALATLGVTINAGTSTIAVQSFEAGDHNYHNVVFNGSSAVGFTGDNSDDPGVYNNIDVNGGTQFTLQGSRTINGRLRFGVTGMTYLIDGGSTTTINGVFELPSSTCGALSAIRSTITGTQATITKSSGAVTGARLVMRDIAGTGGATYTANSSIDEGNNTGWTFTSSAAQNFYWIGGSGDWNDGTKWSFTSGGVTANCTPSINDNVFFDVNSFNAAGQTVTLTSGDKYCHNMNWTGVSNNPTLNVGAARMHVYGSFTLNAAMTLTNTLVVNAGFYFEATTAGQTIQTFGKTLYYDVFFRGTATGSWTLQDELRAFDRIYFQGGTLNTNNQNITMMSSQGEIFFSRNFPSSFTGAPIVINLGSSTLTASHVGSALATFGVTINAGTSTIAVQTFEAGDHNYHNVVFNGSSAVGFISDVSDDPGVYNNIDVNGGTQFTLQGSRTINGRLRFGVTGMTYLIDGGSTTTINGVFELPSSTCGALSAFRSTITGTQATITKSSGAVTGARLSIRDIAGTGGATYTANSSIDEGNNTGWTFTSSAPQNFYWIGGSGDWNDGTKWSFSSGGAIANCTPSITDDVFFDINSFNAAGQTVTLTSGDKYCHNMNWTGVTNNPTFHIGAARLHVYGSLTLNAAMTLTNTLVVNAGFYFEATTSGQTIQTFGKTIYYDVFFRGTATGSWTLQDELRVFDRIYFQGGTLNTNNQNITMMSSQGQIFFARDFPNSFTGAPIVINLGSSTLTASHVGSALATFGVTINAGTSTIAVQTFEAGDHNYHNVVFNGSGNVGFTGDVFDDGGSYNNIDVNSGTDFTLQGSRTINGRLRLGVPGLNASIEVGSVTTFNGILESAGTLAQRVNIFSSSAGSIATFQKSNGNLCVEFITLRDNTKAGTGSFFASNSIDNGNNTGWVFTSQTCLAVLPVQLSVFETSCTQEGVLFKWKTVSEQNSSHFEIQKQTIGGWVVIGNVRASGMSQVERSYQYQSAIETGGVYRLVSVDLDGKKTYSNSKNIICDLSNKKMSIIPNPVHKILILRINTTRPAEMNLQVINTTGQVVSYRSLKIIQGVNKFEMDVSMLPPGKYILNVQSTEGKTLLPFVKL